MLWDWRDLIWFNRFPHGCHDSLEEDVMDVWGEKGKIFHSAFVFIYLFIYLAIQFIYLNIYSLKWMWPLELWWFRCWRCKWWLALICIFLSHYPWITQTPVCHFVARLRASEGARARVRVCRGLTCVFYARTAVSVKTPQSLTHSDAPIFPHIRASDPLQSLSWCRSLHLMSYEG